MWARGGTKAAPRAPGPARGRCCPAWAGVRAPPLPPCCREGPAFHLAWALSDALSLPYRSSAAAESRQLLPGKLPAMLGKAPCQLQPGRRDSRVTAESSRGASKAWQRDELPSSRVPFPENSPFVTGSEPFLSICPTQETWAVAPG